MMTIATVHKLERLMLALMVVALPFHGILERFEISFVATTLSNYFFIAGLFFLIYEWKKFGFQISKRALKIFSIYIVWQIICLAIGLVTFGYDYLLNVEQIPKLAWIIDKFASYGISLNKVIAMKLWIFARYSKSILIFNNQIWLIAFYVYHLYKDNYEKGFRDIRRAVMVLLVIMGTYSLVELAWLKLSYPGSEKILVAINNMLYIPKSSHGWWPPLLWKNQLRSVCHEPAFFGSLMAFSFPFLWSFVWEKKMVLFSLFLVFYFTVLVAATNARTAIIITSGEIVLLIVLALLTRRRLSVLLTSLILVVSLGAYKANLIRWDSLLYLNNQQSIAAISSKDKIQIKKSEPTSANKYLQDNVMSVLEPRARSNQARFGNNVAYFKVARSHPFFGVGEGLASPYVDSNIPEFAKNNIEIKLWGRMMREKGFLVSDYPPLNKLLSVAANNGLLGLLLFVFPLVYVCYRLLKYRNEILSKSYSVFLLISTSGMFVSMFSHSTFIECNGILWGLLYCLLNGMLRDEDKELYCCKSNV